MVVHLKGLEFAEPIHQRMSKCAIEEKTAFDLRAPLLSCHPVIGREHLNGMPSKLKCLSIALTSKIKGACMMRRIQIGQDQNSHAGSRLRGSSPVSTIGP